MACIHFLLCTLKLHLSDISDAPAHRYPYAYIWELTARAWLAENFKISSMGKIELTTVVIVFICFYQTPTDGELHVACLQCACMCQYANNMVVD